MPLFKQTSPEERFWNWFQDNSERLLHFEDEQERIFDTLENALHKVNKGLTFEFGPVGHSPREFIVSADGIRDVLPAVIRLVDAAPSMDKWQVIAFQQPKSLDFTIRMNGTSLCADDISFRHEQDDERIGLDIFISGLTDANSEALVGAAFILLDCALGEYVVLTRLSFIEFHPFPGSRPEHGLIPLRKLADIITASP